jgi:superfamily I DNA/RNA helicase
MLHQDGEGFGPDELAAVDATLRRLDSASRVAYRDRNADQIAASAADRLLIVAGPGTGKSHLFLARIRDWLKRFPGERIYVSSFVRKLVRDLESEVDTSDLAPAEKALVTVKTLHGLARSLIERNHGTKQLPMKPYIRVITQAWKDTIWSDVLGLLDDSLIFPFEDLEAQFHNPDYIADEPWPALRQKYFDVCRFYNAIGFADSILHATEALRETPELSGHALWIVDEFQDFNLAENELIQTCASDAVGLLLVGDDDQALYQQLKASHPEIIRAQYADPAMRKAMLPYCGRSSFHICMGATAFLHAQREPGSIQKVFLPLDADESAQRIQVVGCSDPTRAVDYVIQFIEGHRHEIQQRRVDILAGHSKDPFLLILSPTKDVDVYYGDAARRLTEAVEAWRLEEAGPAGDFYRVLTYYGAARSPQENLPVRKVFAYEGVQEDRIHEVLRNAFERGIPLSGVDHEIIDATLKKCHQVECILDDDRLSAADKTEALVALVDVQDPDRLAQDIEAFFRDGDALPVEEEEEIETAGTISPVTMMTMVGAKGLSADHVILLGFDPVNMGYASPQLFFVAMTRARRSLHLLTARKARGADRPHDFLDDVPEEHCDHLIRTANEITAHDTRAEFRDRLRRWAWGARFGRRRKK